jgi:hypothetical protein
MWTIYTMEFCSATKEEGNPDIHSKMDGAEGYYVK